MTHKGTTVKKRSMRRRVQAMTMEARHALHAMKQDTEVEERNRSHNSTEIKMSVQCVERGTWKL